MITTEMDSARDENAAKNDAGEKDRAKGKRKVEEDRGSKVVVWLLEKSGQWPPVHGRGISDRFAEDFVRACGEGKGVVEMRSQHDTEDCRKRQKGEEDE